MMAEFDTGEVRLWYETEGGGPPLMLVHGNAASSRWWDLVWAPLTRNYTVTRMDLRGFGRSDKPRDGYTVEQIASDLASLAREQGTFPARWVGHSLGGAVVLQLCLDWPELVRDMVLIDPAPADGMPITEEALEDTERMSKDREVTRVALEAISPRLDHATAFFDRLVDDAMDATGWIPMVRALTHWNIVQRLSEIRNPALILHGSNDVLVPAQRVGEMASRMHRATMTLIPEVGHSLPVEDPKRLIQEIENFHS